MNLTESRSLDRHFCSTSLLCSTYLGRQFVQNCSSCVVDVILRSSNNDLRLLRLTRWRLGRCRWWRRRVERRLTRSRGGRSFTASELLSGSRSGLLSSPISVSACWMSSSVRLVRVVPRALSGLTPRIAFRASTGSPVLSVVTTRVPDLNVGRFGEGWVAWTTLDLAFLKSNNKKLKRAHPNQKLN